MRKIYQQALFLLFLFLVFQGHSQIPVDCFPEPYKVGTNICRNDLSTSASYTSNSVTISEPANTPVATSATGPFYTVTIRYSDPNGGCMEKIITNASVSVGSNSFTITLPSGQTWDHTILNGTFKIWINFVEEVTSGRKYFYHTTNGDCDYVFPVKFKSFNYSYTTDKYLKLTWVTASESNSSHFIVEYTDDNVNWIAMGQEPAAGESTSDITYNFYGTLHSSGYRVFRIKEVDNDGSLTFSPYIRVSGSGDAYNPKDFYNKIYLEGPDVICSDNLNTLMNVYKLHNTFPDAPFWTSDGSFGSLSITHGGLVAQVSPTGQAGTTTISAIPRMPYAAKSKSVSFISSQSNFGVSTELARSTTTTAYYDAYVSMTPGTNGLHYTWYKNGVSLGTGAYRGLSVTKTQGTALFEVRLNTSCSQGSYQFYLDYQEPISTCRSTDYYHISPVPARGKITISPNRIEPCYRSYAAKSSEIYTLQIIDMYGYVKKEQRNVSLKNSYQLDISDVPAGYYVLQLLSDGETIKKQVRIEQ